MGDTMNMFKIGDIVARKSYGCDILFKIDDILESKQGIIMILKGITYRLLADAPESDLLLKTENLIKDCNDRKLNV
jgi:spore coat assemly protein